MFETNEFLFIEVERSKVCRICGKRRSIECFNYSEDACDHCHNDEEAAEELFYDHE